MGWISRNKNAEPESGASLLSLIIDLTARVTSTERNINAVYEMAKGRHSVAWACIEDQAEHIEELKAGVEAALQRSEELHQESMTEITEAAAVANGCDSELRARVGDLEERLQALEGAHRITPSQQLEVLELTLARNEELLAKMKAEGGFIVNGNPLPLDDANPEKESE